jgi:hypothetical protein
VSGYSVKANGLARPAGRIGSDLSLPAVKRTIAGEGPRVHPPRAPVKRASSVAGLLSGLAQTGTDENGRAAGQVVETVARLAVRVAQTRPEWHTAHPTPLPKTERLRRRGLRL